jgi:3-oxoacyl-[acyl-carrier-protein] synthase III
MTEPRASVTAVDYYLPERPLTNDDLVRECAGRTADEIAGKTGVLERRIASDEEGASDLAVAAARRLFANTPYRADGIDFVILCTQSPDYLMPATACAVQHRLGIPTAAGALDINAGCAAFVYALGVAKGLIETGQVRRVLVLTAETYSRFIGAEDRATRSLFGDAGAATIVEAREGDESDDVPWMGPFVFGTDGSGVANLIVPEGGMRAVYDGAGASAARAANGQPALHMHMNGPAVFDFASRAAPLAVQELCARAGLLVEDVDLFFFHQASKYILETVRSRLRIDRDRFVMALDTCGNTGCCSIPIAMHRAASDGRLADGQRIALVGFGSGYSWSAALLRWHGSPASF